MADAQDAPRVWLWQVYQHSRGASRDALFAYFRGPTKKNDLTPDIMNLINLSVKSCFPEQQAPSSSTHSSSSLQEWAIDKPACATYLYYMVAQHLLQQLFPQQGTDPSAGPAGQQQQPAKRRFKGLVRQVTPCPACSELVASEEFHLPVVECAVQLVAFIAEEGREHENLPWATQQLRRQGFAASLWQATRSFQECFSSSSACPMPPMLQRYLEHMQGLLLDGPALATGSQLYTLMERGGGCHFPEGDTSLVENVLRAYAQQAVHRAQLVGWHILQQQQQQQLLGQQHGALCSANTLQAAAASQQQQQQVLLPGSFPEQCAWLMDRLLLEHLDLCFGQAMSVVVACVVYVSAKLLQASLTFRMVTDVIASCVEHTPAGVFQRAELQPTQTDAAAEYGDVRTFYNARFLPVIEANVRQYLQNYHQHMSCSMQGTRAPAAVAIAAARSVDIMAFAPAVQTAPAAGAPCRRPLEALNANTQAAACSGDASTLSMKAALDKGTPSEGPPLLGADSNQFSNLVNKAGPTAAAAAAAAATSPAGVNVLPGHGQLGFFDGATVSSSVAALIGHTPTRLMR